MTSVETSTTDPIPSWVPGISESGDGFIGASSISWDTFVNSGSAGKFVLS